MNSASECFWHIVARLAVETNLTPDAIIQRASSVVSKADEYRNPYPRKGPAQPKGGRHG